MVLICGQTLVPQQWGEKVDNGDVNIHKVSTNGHQPPISTSGVIFGLISGVLNIYTLLKLSGYV